MHYCSNMRNNLGQKNMHRTSRSGEMQRCLQKKSGRSQCVFFVCWVFIIILPSGCTSFQDYVHNGFKVGPGYCCPTAQVAQSWIDSDDKRVRSSPTI